MKKSISVLLSLFLSLLCLLGCNSPEVGWDPWAWDSRYFHLPNDHGVSITGAEGGSLNIGYRTRVVYPIAEFCYNEQFVCMKNTSAINAQNKVIPLENEEWYILDGLEEIVYGPYGSLQEYEKALEDFGVTGLSDWIATAEKQR